MFKVNNEDTKTTRRRFGVFIVNFEHISHLCSSVSFVNFEHVIAGWEAALYRYSQNIGKLKIS